MDIVVWLRSLGLVKYEALFRENDIDDTVLLTLTAEDLKDLGVTPFGHRRKLVDAIAALRNPEGIANPNGVVVSESTRKLVGNPFELQGLGGQDLKFSPWVIDVPVPVPRLPRANRTWIKAALLLYCTAVFLMTYTPWNVVFILAAFSLARSDALPQRMRIDPGAG
jgi:SAM domain (Sterile alpha motif)